MKRLDKSTGSSQYCHPMFRLPPLVRRCFAAFATLTVLVAPVTQVAHAQAMTHAAQECAHPASSHQHAPASSPHTQQHQHGGTCCDFCATGCATTIPLPVRATAIATPIARDAVVAGAPARSIRIVRLPHAFPFSLAPPLPTA